MTLQQFKDLKEGQLLYDAKLSRRYRRHVTTLVRGHDKHDGGIKLYSDGVEELIPYDDYLFFDVMPEDTSQLPFY